MTVFCCPLSLVTCPFPRCMEDRHTATLQAKMTDTAKEITGLSFIKYVLENLVEDKGELSVEGRIDELGVLITVKVSERDMGKLIGKGGQTVKALRTLLRILGGNANQRVNLKIIEPGMA